MRHALFAIALVGCARGGVGQLTPGDGNEVVIDGEVFNDAPAQSHDDAKVYLDAKQFEDAHVFNDAHIYNDAHVYMDAKVYMDACAQVQVELLLNPGFDSGPNGQWHEVQPVDAPSELISTYLPQAGTYGAWLGSYDTGNTESDELFQDVAVPAGTTALTLTGYWLVGTTETGGVAYDTSTVSLAHPNETPIETALTLSNLNATTTTTYTAFSHSFAVAGVAGTTVRFKLASTSDFSNLTNFFYDTLSLKATYCP